MRDFIVWSIPMAVATLAFMLGALTPRGRVPDGVRYGLMGAGGVSLIVWIVVELVLGTLADASGVLGQIVSLSVLVVGYLGVGVLLVGWPSRPATLLVSRLKPAAQARLADPIARRLTAAGLRVLGAYCLALALLAFSHLASSVVAS